MDEVDKFFELSMFIHDEIDNLTNVTHIREIQFVVRKKTFQDRKLGTDKVNGEFCKICKRKKINTSSRQAVS